MEIQETEMRLIPKEEKFVIKTDSLESIRESVASLDKGYYELTGAWDSKKLFIDKLSIRLSKTELFIQAIEIGDKGVTLICKHRVTDYRGTYGKVTTQNLYDTRISLNHTASRTMTITKTK